MEKHLIRRNYKDSLFRMIFNSREELLSLYNAVNGSDYQNPAELEINTIEDVIYIGIKNDISFLIDDCLNLYEAQSTWNPNMPLRGVFYLSQIYQGYVEQHQLDIYSHTRLPLPAPRYIVFYNGREKTDDVVQVRLSDSFAQPEKECLSFPSADSCVHPAGNDGSYALECVATYLNVNYGHNVEIMKNCRKLYEYARLIDEIRKKLDQGLNLETAVSQAITVCITEGILEDFLRRHRAEVTSMILTEYNAERHIKNEKEQSYQAGVREGILEGKKYGILEGKIEQFIETCREFGECDAAIISRLKEKFSLTEDDAQKWLNHSNKEENSDTVK